MSGRLVYANADRRGYRTEENRRRKDIEFLEKVRTATIEELREMHRKHLKGPDWKLVAIRRAIHRVTMGR